MSWLARVSVCVAVTAPTLAAVPALANGKFIERFYTTENGSVYKVRQPEGAVLSDKDVMRAVADRSAADQAAAADAADATAAAPADAKVATKAAPAADKADAAVVRTAKAAAPVAAAPAAARTTPATVSTKSAEPSRDKTTEKTTESTPVDNRDLSCLAEALYYEARGEGSAGQKAVAEVILNRVDHPRFPKSVCGVVNQSGQFSYHGRVSKRFSEKAAYQRAKHIAKAALAGAPRNLTGGATYFHTGGVRPSWSRKFTRTTRIGSHIFYHSGGGQRLASN